MVATTAWGAMSESEVYRLAQFDRGGKEFGSRRVTCTHIAAALPRDVDSTILGLESEAAKKANVLSRSVIVAHISDLTDVRLVEVADGRKAAGLVIVVDSDITNVDEETLKKWRALEQYMVSRAWDFPIYFAFGDDQVKDMVKLLNQRERSQSGSTFDSKVSHVANQSKVNTTNQ